MSFVEKLMELEFILLSKINQAQKEKYHIFSHMQNLDVMNSKGHEHRRGLWGEGINERWVGEKTDRVGGENH
jgi:hypothetical protein